MTTPRSSDPDATRQRTVRSFVRRAGRMTTAQKRAFETLWPRYGLDFAPEPCDLPTVFGNPAPVTLEIGFGNGDSLIAMAAARPGCNFLGIEVHEPGVGHCMLLAERQTLSNVRIICHDAVEVLRGMIAKHSLARINLFFPDPWHKKRHHKRRIVQPDFADLVAGCLLPGGIFHVVTDWPDYAAHIDAVMSVREDFESMAEPPDDRVITRFDRRGERLGHRNHERAWRTCSKLPMTD